MASYRVRRRQAPPQAARRDDECCVRSQGAHLREVRVRYPQAEPRTTFIRQRRREIGAGLWSPMSDGCNILASEIRKCPAKPAKPAHHLAPKRKDVSETLYRYGFVDQKRRSRRCSLHGCTDPIAGDPVDENWLDLRDWQNWVDN